MYQLGCQQGGMVHSTDKIDNVSLGIDGSTLKTTPVVYFNMFIQFLYSMHIIYNMV